MRQTPQRTIRRIGIMGGTFDPPHLGHLSLAKEAQREFELSEVWFMPAGDPYFKKDKTVSRGALRYRMTELLIEDSPGFSVSDLELRRTGNTYTSETMELLHKRYPEDQFFFIIGADTLLQLPDWHEPEVLFRNTVLLCAGRPGVSEQELSERIRELRERYRESGADIRRIHAKELAISATMIRRRIQAGESCSGLLPEAVDAYIREHRLYL